MVVKGLAAGLVHRSEVGAVILDLESAPEVAVAVSTLRRRMAVAGMRLD